MRRASCVPSSRLRDSRGTKAIKGRLRFVCDSATNCSPLCQCGRFSAGPKLDHVFGCYCAFFCCLSSPRNFILALCNCDFEVPTEHPSIRAISSCSCPSISWSVKTVRYPGGNWAMALSKAIRSTTGMAFGFSVPLTIWIGASPSSVVCSRRTPRLRKCIKT